MEGVKYYANEPRLIGKVFLRLERDFDKHVAYCRDEPHAQNVLDDDDIRDFFEVNKTFLIYRNYFYTPTTKTIHDGKRHYVQCFYFKSSQT